MSTDKKNTSKATRFGFIGLSSVALMVAAFLSGCDDKRDATGSVAPAAPASQSVSTEVKREAERAADETKKMAEDAKDAVESAADKVGDEAKKAADAVK